MPNVMLMILKLAFFSVALANAAYAKVANEKEKYGEMILHLGYASCLIVMYVNI